MDAGTKLVHCGAVPSSPAPKRHRFSVSLDASDYDALQRLGAAQRPPLKQQYLVELAVKNFLDHHANKQLTFPLNDDAS